MGKLSKEWKEKAYRKNVGEFVGIDSQLEEQLVQELNDVMDKALRAMWRVLRKLRKPGLDFTFGETREILEEARKAFDEVWIPGAKNVMIPQVISAMKRGVVQGKDLIAITQEKLEEINEFSERGNKEGSRAGAEA